MNYKGKGRIHRGHTQSNRAVQSKLAGFLIILAKG